MEFKVRSENDKDTAIPRFFTQPVHMTFKSEEAGRPIYEDRVFVEIITPGIAKSMPVEEVTDEHKRRWPQSYRAFVDGQEEALDGMPLEQWPGMSPSMILMLKGLHIRTVEELSNVTDLVIEDIGLGGRQLRDRASDYVKRMQESAPLEAALAREARMEEQMALMSKQIADLKALVPNDPAEERRGPGRPRKVEE